MNISKITTMRLSLLFAAALVMASALGAAPATAPLKTAPSPASPAFKPYKLDGLNTATFARRAPPYYAVRYEASEKPGELQMDVTFTVWVPPGVKRLRGVIVHQHGCGNGAGQGGATAAYDLHWQALARKWDCALLGPSYEMKEGQECRLWCDAIYGSDKAFLRALTDLGGKSGHPEMATVPWALWGHSGGGFWSSYMQALYPERIAAIWLRSGAAWMAWETGERVKPKMPAEAWDIPMAFNVGVEELIPTTETARQRLTWRRGFEVYREQGALICWAPDPHSGHECLDSRYAAIAFFESCLAQRLPEPGAKSQKLRPMNRQLAWIAESGTPKAQPAAEFRGTITAASWLPDERFAKVWMRYVVTGGPLDDTPPPAPFVVRVSEGNVIAWAATADVESGLAGFIIERDGREIARVPEKPTGYGRTGLALFQGMTHGDTPVIAEPAMAFTDRTAKVGENHTYRVIAVNSAGLRSAGTNAE